MKISFRQCDWTGCEEHAYKRPFSMDGPVGRGKIQTKDATFPKAVLRIYIYPCYQLETDIDSSPIDRVLGTLPHEELEFCREHWKVIIEELDEELDGNLGFLKDKE